MPANLFTIDPLTFATIVGMALVTYATRVGGLWLMSRITPSPFVQAWMQNIPGAVLVSIVAPDAFLNGPADALAAGLTALVAARSRNLLLSMAVGVVAAWVLRQFIPR